MKTTFESNVVIFHDLGLRGPLISQKYSGQYVLPIMAHACNQGEPILKLHIFQYYYFGAYLPSQAGCNFDYIIWLPTYEAVPPTRRVEFDRVRSTYAQPNDKSDGLDILQITSNNLMKKGS